MEMKVKENISQEHIYKENTTEKSLVKKGENSLKNRDVSMIKPIVKTTVGILFYAATFIISMAISYIFIFSVFE